MKNFYDRVNELASLERFFDGDEAVLYVLYGRRRLGKTTLLRRFASDRAGVYHMADRSTERDAIRSLARSMGDALGDLAFANPQYASFGDLFDAYDRARPLTRSYLIIDEYQYLCETQPALSSIIQKHWDERWRDSSLMIVLCGSILSMMHKETLARSSPLYGRRTGQWLLRPMRFKDTCAFFDRAAPLDKLKLWGLGGGVPRYAELAGRFKTFAAALRELVLSKDGPLYSEARFLLQDEVSTPNVYWSILQAVASGANRISEIAGRVGLPANQLTRYLAALSDMGLVFREVPVTERNPSKSKRGLHRLEDPFLRLWFGSVAPFESLLEFGRIEAAETKMEDRLTQHLSWSFESICRQFVEDRSEELGAVRVGRYWDKSTEIDVVAVDENDEVVFAGEAKWAKGPLAASVGKALSSKVAALWPGRVDKIQKAVFSAGGFSPQLRSWGRDSGALLVGVDEFVG